MRDGLSDLHPSRIVARRMHELETELERARAYRRQHSKSPETTGRWGLEQPSAPQQEESWFITYLDMMTLLLVVMIVMLAFSGSLGERAGSVQPADQTAAAVAAAEIKAPEAAQSAAPLLAAAPAVVPAQIAAESPPEPVAKPTPAPAPEPVETETPPAAQAAQDPAPATTGTGLLPGGSGLLPSHHAGMADAAAVSETLPGWRAASAIPASWGHPADVGPLPLDAQVIAGKTAIPLPAHTTATLYPGYGAADLAASFIGPPRPAAAPTHADDAVPAMAATIEDDAPSEGESLAAGLSLGDLGNDVQVVVNERSVSFRVNSEILFDSSQADLSRSGLSVLRRIVGVLSDTSHEVTVEGHTDSVPVRRNVRYPSNWELSSARAGSVVRYLQANGIDRTRLRAIGYADTRPIADNNTPAGRAGNRRVELIIEKRD